MRKILPFLALLLFVGCASKDKDISEQTALFWHNKIYKDISRDNLDKADEDLTSLELEHPKSSFIKQDLLALYEAHKNYEDYELAKFYLDEYKKRYALKSNWDWCDYKTIQINFISFQQPYTNQVKLNEIITTIQKFKNEYPNSQYLFYINTMETKLNLTKKFFNQRIADLYKRTGHLKSAKIYETNITKEAIAPHIPWYKAMFYW